MHPRTMNPKIRTRRSIYLLLLPFVLVLVLLRSYLHRPLDCGNTIRLGDAYGGWVMCTPLQPLNNRLVYTVGIGRNIEWDKAMIHQYGTQHHGWDPTPTAEDFFRKSPPPDAFVFHKIGLGAHDGNHTLKLPVGNQDSYTVMAYHEEAKPGTVTTVPILSVASMLKTLGHSKLAILKIDIEGAEFDVITEWHNSRYRVPAEQVLVEFHERYFRTGGKLVENAVRQMADLGYDLVFKTKLEYTFARHNAIGPFS